MSKKQILATAIITLLISLLIYCLIDLDQRWKFVNAAQRGDLVKLSQKLDSGFDPNTRAYPGSVTALRMAIVNHQKAAVQLLLERGANPNDGIYLAVATNQTDITRLLLKGGAKVNIYDNGESIIDVAKQKHNKEIIKMLKLKLASKSH